MRGPSRSRCRCQADTRSTAQGTSIDDESRIIYTCHAALAVSAEHVASAGSPGALALAGELLGGREHQAREQARLIRSGAAGELTEADVERMATDIAAAARAQLDAAAPHSQSPWADPELQATRREAAQLMAAAARQVDAELRRARRAWQEKVAGRRWRR